MFDFFRKILTNASGADAPPPSMRAPSHTLETAKRKSNGLKYFFSVLPERNRLDVLDLGGLSQANLDVLSEFGGTVHAIDLIEYYDHYKRERAEEGMDAELARDFVDEYLNFSKNQFDAIFAWDCLEFLDSDIVYLAVPRLGEILRPGGAMLTFFHTQGRGEVVPACRYSIDGGHELALQPRDLRSLPNTFNNRSLERLFADFESIKFFLTRDSIREVIVSR